MGRIIVVLGYLVHIPHGIQCVDDRGQPSLGVARPLEPLQSHTREAHVVSLQHSLHIVFPHGLQWMGNVVV